MLSRSVIDRQRIDEDEQGSDGTLHDLLYWWSPFFLLNCLEVPVFEMLRVRLECWGLDGKWKPISRPMKFEHGYYGSGYWPAFEFCQVYWSFLCMRVRVIVVREKLGRENNVKEKNFTMRNHEGNSGIYWWISCEYRDAEGLSKPQNFHDLLCIALWKSATQDNIDRSYENPRVQRCNCSLKMNGSKHHDIFRNGLVHVWGHGILYFPNTDQTGGRQKWFIG